MFDRYSEWRHYESSPLFRTQISRILLVADSNEFREANSMVKRMKLHSCEISRKSFRISPNYEQNPSKMTKMNFTIPKFWNNCRKSFRFSSNFEKYPSISFKNHQIKLSNSEIVINPSDCHQIMSKILQNWPKWTSLFRNFEQIVGNPSDFHQILNKILQYPSKTIKLNFPIQKL